MPVVADVWSEKWRAGCAKQRIPGEADGTVRRGAPVDRDVRPRQVPGFRVSRPAGRCWLAFPVRCGGLCGRPSPEWPVYTAGLLVRDAKLGKAAGQARPKRLAGRSRKPASHASHAAHTSPLRAAARLSLFGLR